MIPHQSNPKDWGVTSPTRRLRVTLSAVLSNRDDFEWADWNKLRHLPTGALVLPAVPRGLRIDGDPDAVVFDATGEREALVARADAVARRCEELGK